MTASGVLAWLYATFKDPCILDMGVRLSTIKAGFNAPVEVAVPRTIVFVPSRTIPTIISAADLVDQAAEEAVSAPAAAAASSGSTLEWLVYRLLDGLDLLADLMGDWLLLFLAVLALATCIGFVYFLRWLDTNLDATKAECDLLLLKGETAQSEEDDVFVLALETQPEDPLAESRKLLKAKDDIIDQLQREIARLKQEVASPSTAPIAEPTEEAKETPQDLTPPETSTPSAAAPIEESATELTDSSVDPIVTEDTASPPDLDISKPPVEAIDDSAESATVGETEHLDDNKLPSTPAAQGLPSTNKARIPLTNTICFYKGNDQHGTTFPCKMGLEGKCVGKPAEYFADGTYFFENRKDQHFGGMDDPWNSVASSAKNNDETRRKQAIQAQICRWCINEYFPNPRLSPPDRRKAIEADHESRGLEVLLNRRLKQEKLSTPAYQSVQQQGSAHYQSNTTQSLSTTKNAYQNGTAQSSNQSGPQHQRTTAIQANNQYQPSSSRGLHQSNHAPQPYNNGTSRGLYQSKHAPTPYNAGRPQGLYQSTHAPNPYGSGGSYQHGMPYQYHQGQPQQPYPNTYRPQYPTQGQTLNPNANAFHQQYPNQGQHNQRFYR